MKKPYEQKYYTIDNDTQIRFSVSELIDVNEDYRFESEIFINGKYLKKVQHDYIQDLNYITFGILLNRQWLDEKDKHDTAIKIDAVHAVWES
jgi:hypothetical protein